MLGKTFQLCLNNGNNIFLPTPLLQLYQHFSTVHNCLNNPTIVFLFNRLFLSVSLFNSSTLTTWSIRILKVCLFSYSLLSVNSLFFLFLFLFFLYFILILSTIYICFLFNFCLNDGKQWKRGETLNLYLGLFCFPIPSEFLLL